MLVEPSAAFCDSCGKVLEGESGGKNCTSCETLISAEAPSCPICGEKFPMDPGQTPQDGEDDSLISQLMTWTKARAPQTPEDTVEDKKEREHALHVLRSLTIGESEEATQARMEKLEKPGKDKAVAESREKQLIKVGKPFEATLEQNMVSINQTQSALTENKLLMKQLEGNTDPDSLETRRKLQQEIRELEEKKHSLISYQSDILMMGGAYRKLLKEHQGELLNIEAELKKRVEAFRKELDRRKKQKERLRKRETALDKREEDLSHRFLDLKKRSNEIIVREKSLVKVHEELKLKEEALAKWEEEIAASREIEAKAKASAEAKPGISKEEWLKQHQELQADLRMVRSDVAGNGKDPQPEQITQELMKLKDKLKEKENELHAREKELGELKGTVQEKDKEIEKLTSASSENSIDEDTRKLLKVLDDLLEKLPEEIVDKFAKSDDYLLYEKILDFYKI
jgi:DNA repair exonuclease SbcCD ATPase subunit